MCMLDEIRAKRDEIYAIARRRKAEKLWVACAESADCDWFFTTDNRLIKKAKAHTSMRVANPVEFFGGD